MEEEKKPLKRRLSESSFISKGSWERKPSKEKHIMWSSDDDESMEDDDSEMLMDEHVQGVIYRWMTLNLHEWVPPKLIGLFMEFNVRNCKQCGGKKEEYGVTGCICNQ